jgi:hypothetical protein
MYRHILGDCFLIRTQHDGKPWHALIDFGILQGSPGRAETSDSIVASIGETCGWKLDLLVVTHEHADHISGFGQERAQFFGKPGGAVPVFDIAAVWLAWTEKLDDPQAKVLHETRRIAGSAVRLAAGLASPLAAAGDTAALTEGRLIAGLARFLPEGDDLGPDGGEVMGLDIDLSGRFTGARVMEALRLHPRVRYLEPGEAIAVGPMRAHVLGPPRGEAFLARSDPRSGTAREVYLTDPARALALAAEVRQQLDAMAAATPGAVPAATGAESPFAARHHRPIAAAVAEGDALALAYTDPANAWRQINAAYLNAARELALQLDSDTNNTSLVLVFELPDGQVMLFPADAQVGNWLSWGEQTYPRDAPGAVDIANLLSRVTLYKVGHHASHNATLRERGLELMTDPRLSAMIPVDRDVAQSQDWAFPFPDLEKRLAEKTGGRLVMGDGDIAAEAAAFAGSKHARVAHDPDPACRWVEVIIPSVAAGAGAAVPPAKPRRRRKRNSPAG